MTDSPIQWFGVRCVFEHARLPETDQRVFEERITLWQAANLGEAINLSEAEGAEYASILGAEYLGLAQAYRIDGLPKQGSEVFSLIRDSDLSPSEYLTAFFDTGHEYQRDYRSQP